MPDIFFDALDQVPAELREFAKDENGRVVVNVVPKVKLDEFRDNNIAVSRERDQLKAGYTRAVSLLGTEDFDTAEQELQGLRQTNQRVRDGKLVEDTSLESAIQQRTASMRESYDEQIRREVAEKGAWREKAAGLDLQLRRGVVERAVASAVLADDSGADHRALQDITARAFSVFQVTDDGKLIAKNGDAMIYGDDGVSAMSPAEWLKKLRQETPYFFKSSNGGGAGGGNSGPIRNHGMTDSEFQKLTPEQRLRFANGEKIRT